MSATRPDILLHFGLAMTPAAGRRGDPAAWFIPGTAADWLDELVRWKVPLTDATLYLIPRSIHDPSPCGVLVRCDAPKPKTRTALPYAAPADRLFFPANARLDPEPTAAEVRQHLLYDVNVLHPTAGLVGFNTADGMTLDALLVAPRRKPARWTMALPGLPPRPPLSSVRGEVLPSIEEVLESARGDIGSAADADAELPLSSDESRLKDALGHAAATGLQPLFSALSKLLAAGSTGETSKGGTRQWLAVKLKAMNSPLEEHRQRELNRLLRLMKDDPETGL